MKTSERVYQRLMDEILEGTLTPGAPLSEVDQAQRLGSSRTPLREALSRLEAAGLVISSSGRRTRVAPITHQGIIRLFEMRRALEELGVRLAARRNTSAVFKAMADEFADASITLVDTPESVDAYYLLNQRFDEAVTNAADNEYLSSGLRTIRFHATRLRQIARTNPHRLRESARETRVICEAIDAGDEELAAHSTHLHLHNSLEHIVSSLPAGDIDYLFLGHKPEGALA